MFKVQIWDATSIMCRKQGFVVTPKETCHVGTYLFVTVNLITFLKLETE
jgi:hypothetical protein